jgi:hypothetical protein
MSHIDATYGRRAQQAAPAARTALDDLDASLSASPANRARNEVAKESRAELERHLDADASRVDLATLRRLLHEKKQRFPPTAALRDGGLKIHLHLARLERYIQLRAQEEQWQQQQQQQQQQQLLPEEPDGRSKRWLEVVSKGGMPWLSVSLLWPPARLGRSRAPSSGTSQCTLAHAPWRPCRPLTTRERQSLHSLLGGCGKWCPLPYVQDVAVVSIAAWQLATMLPYAAANLWPR